MSEEKTEVKPRKKFRFRFWAVVGLAVLATVFGLALLVNIFQRKQEARNPFYRTLFNMAILVITIQAAGQVYRALGGRRDMDVALMIIPLAGMAMTYFFVNTIPIAIAIALVLVAALEWTRFGAQVRAAVDNQRMARGLGLNVDRAFAITFALGSGLAGLGGALAIPMVGLDPNFAFTYLIYVLIVVSVGGLASIGGSFAAAALLGVSDMAGKYYVPALGSFLIYLLMVGLLMWRPAGLFGKR